MSTGSIVNVDLSIDVAEYDRDYQTIVKTQKNAAEFLQMLGVLNNTYIIDMAYNMIGFLQDHDIQETPYRFYTDQILNRYDPHKLFIHEKTLKYILDLMKPAMHWHRIEKNAKYHSGFVESWIIDGHTEFMLLNGIFMFPVYNISKAVIQHRDFAMFETYRYFWMNLVDRVENIAYLVEKDMHYEYLKKIQSSKEDEPTLMASSLEKVEEEDPMLRQSWVYFSPGEYFYHTEQEYAMTKETATYVAGLFQNELQQYKVRGKHYPWSLKGVNITLSPVSKWKDRSHKLYIVVAQFGDVSNMYNEFPKKRGSSRLLYKPVFFPDDLGKSVSDLVPHLKTMDPRETYSFYEFNIRYYNDVKIDQFMNSLQAKMHWNSMTNPTNYKYIVNQEWEVLWVYRLYFIPLNDHSEMNECIRYYYYNLLH